VSAARSWYIAYPPPPRVSESRLLRLKVEEGAYYCIVIKLFLTQQKDNLGTRSIRLLPLYTKFSKTNSQISLLDIDSWSVGGRINVQHVRLTSSFKFNRNIMAYTSERGIKSTCG
jgi:hypothetical protein